jgi:hypothetical protein
MSLLSQNSYWRQILALVSVQQAYVWQQECTG